MGPKRSDIEKEYAKAARAAGADRAAGQRAALGWVLGEVPTSPYRRADAPSPTRQLIQREWNASRDADEGGPLPHDMSRTYGSAVHAALGWVLGFDDYERPSAA